MFGSFASVVISRLRSWEKWIWTGRSHCTACQRNLSARELVPLFSWLAQWRKCTWCQKKISAFYPLIELTTGILFVCIGYFLIDTMLLFEGNTLEWVRLFFFLWIGFLTILYVFYDIAYMEIPESVLLIANFWVFFGLIAQDIGFRVFDDILPSLALTQNPDMLWLIAGGSITWTMILWLLYIIMLQGMKEIYDCLILLWAIAIVFLYTHVSGIWPSQSALISGSIWALWVFSFFFLQILISGGKWMGWGDLRIAILMGLTLWVGLSFSWVMMSYFAGSIIGIAMILWQKIHQWWKSHFNTQIPFWPFLALGYFWALFFAPKITEFLQYYL